LKISVVVLCYNSERTIIETLNSIFIQKGINRNEIQLVINDDCSSDASLDVINDWVNVHESFFYEVIVLSSKKNRGINFSVNKCWKLCKGEWIKTIAADDLLKEQALISYINFVANNPSSKIVFSKMERFNDKTNSVIDVSPDKKQMKIFEKEVLIQKKLFLRRPFNIAPTSFINNQYLKSLGYVTNKYTNFEDWPLWLECLKNKEKLYFLDEICVQYRVGNSVSNESEKFFNPKMVYVLLSFYRNDVYPEVKGVIEKLYFFENLVDLLFRYIIINLFGNKRNVITKNFYLLSYSMRPTHFVRRIAKLKGRNEKYKN